jgi:site-specific DNA recombinase
MQSETSKQFTARGKTLTRPRLITSTEELRAALYCRFSSDVQNERSIDRQVADLEKVAPRFHLKLNKRLYFEDRGTTATTLFERPGLTRQLLGAAEQKLFDVVLVEHTDRLARKQADMFWLAEQFKLLGVKIFTPSGEVDPLRLTFESYQNEQFSIVLSARVKSGQNDAIREGRIPHGLGYGYDDIKDKPGEKRINDDEAKIVVRIFTEFTSGKSPRKIALDLTRDGILSRDGKTWTFQTIIKMLQNQIYMGVYVRNKVRRIRNYNTGKRDAHPAAPDDLLTLDVPHLRIIDQGLWDAAQKVRLARSSKPFWKQKTRSPVARRLHPFAGLFHCSACGDKMIICGTGRNGDKLTACSTAWWKQTCPHRKSYSLARLTKLATEKMHAHLTDPDFVKERAKERAKELARLERDTVAERNTAQKELDRVDLKIRKLVRLAEDDDSEDVPQEVRDRLKELKIEQRGLKQRLEVLDAESREPTLLPTAMQALARDVDTLYAMLQDNPDDPACRIALGNLLRKVLVHPTGYNQPYDVSLYARHAAYVGEMPLFPEKVSENQGFGRINTGNAVVPSSTLLIRENDTFDTSVLLGRWREAA